METFWRRRHKVSSFAGDQSFAADLLPSTSPASFRGNRQLQKQRKFPKLASDSSSCSSTTEEDPLTFELGWRSSKQSAGTPMKKLLAQEMSKENESRRRAPSVIARLMGLDGLPPQQSGHKQQKRTESSQEKVQKGGTFYSRRSSRKSSKEEQEFKDVFEVLDVSKEESGGYSSQQGIAHAKLSDAEVAFIQQKFMEAKRLSTDEKLQDSEEFNDACEVLDSNKDLLLRFFQQPDSLFTKHLHDLQGAPPQSHCGRISAMKSSHAPNNENGLLGGRAGRTQLKHRNKSPQGYQGDILSHSYGRHAASNSPKSPKVQLEVKNGPAIVPTRIVVLKPNLGKSQNSTRTGSSPCSSHHFPSNCTGRSEILGVENGEAELWGKKMVHQDSGFSRHDSGESRAIAKEITRQMKNSLSNGTMKFSTSRFRGYAGDESSCDVSGSESANDSDVTTVSYRDKIGWNKQHRRSSSRSSESSVSREAKKRLSERWKLTHEPQEMHMVSRGSTLGEMLAISDREVRPANSSGIIDDEGCSELDNDVGSAVGKEPLGISSRDGWKDGCLGNLSRSRSLPASSTDFGSPRINTRHDSLRRDKYVIPGEGFKWDRNKAVKGYYSQREAALPSNRRFCVKKSQFPGSSCSSNKENSDTSPEFLITPCPVEQNVEGDNQSEHNLMVSRASPSTTLDTSSLLENAVVVNDQNKVVLSEPSHVELSAPASPNDDISTGDRDNLNSQEPSDGPSNQAVLHCPASELESRATSKEADQPSPVSVIDAPFTDDLSSGSECFESVSADLHGLRMQLQLLKLESEAYEEGTMLISSDDDADEVASVGFAEDKGIPMAEESLESVYIVDVLVDSGIHGADLDTFLATWHSPECPVNPSVFEELEKKYCHQTSWSRAERRLMFDRINSKLVETYQQYLDQHPWVMMSARTTIPKWKMGEVEDGLRKSLVSQRKKVQMDAGEMVLGRESQWLDLREDIDVIGREIERLLVDELVAEVVTGKIWILV